MPRQGHWDQDAYLWLTDQTSRLIELTGGNIEVLPRPTDEHQSILAYLYSVRGARIVSGWGLILLWKS